jgi:Rrf2 family nitric oxide-sensitive transcriptional repressor
MRIASYTDFALRLLMYVAVRHPAFVTIKAAAEAYGISKNHLMKVAHELSVEGYLETQRGRNGGIRLGRPAEAINIGNVVRLTEKSTVLVECFDPLHNQCVITPVCGLKHVLWEAQEAFYRTLGRYSLADLVRQPKPLEAILFADAQRPAA